MIMTLARRIALGWAILFAGLLGASPTAAVEANEKVAAEANEKAAAAAKKKAAEETDAGKKKIVFIAGKPSHGYAAHAHYAGCALLAKAINASVPQAKAVVFRGGWPADPAAFDGAATIVIYADGGGGQPLLAHRDQLDSLMKKGVGLVCMHWAVEVPKEQPTAGAAKGKPAAEASKATEPKGKPATEAMLAWLGGYFETEWSVNPFWTAEFKRFPDHPITRGVKPFAIEDEWYYHMRFVPEMAGVTPILSAVPPDSTRERPDGPYSNNPAVRAGKGRGLAEHVAWAYQRPDGGRGLGFTGGHTHWNWANDSFRTVVLNGIVWTAGIAVPPAGVASSIPTFEELEANQDFPPPRDFHRNGVEELLNKWHHATK
jgi:hypothetical protein